MKTHLTMIVKETMDTFRISYIEYFFLRYHLLKALDANLAEEFRKMTHRKLTPETLRKIEHTDLGFFITHSDCDGYLSEYVINITLDGFEKIKNIHHCYQDKFERLKKLFKIAQKYNSKIIYL